VDAETGFWLLIGIMSIPLALKFCMGAFMWWFWRVYDRALAEGKVKFTYDDAEE
jgi:hypothetical protein